MNDAHDGVATIILRAPTATDGAAVYDLVAQCPPLDTNSMYCNLLQCSHFSATSVVAECHGEIVGFISGYRRPDRPDILFIWQVAVSEKVRGQGLAGRMLQAVLSRQEPGSTRFIETTITLDNSASWALFARLAHTLGAELNHSVMFERQQHFADKHETEMLVRIGPL